MQTDSAINSEKIGHGRPNKLCASRFRVLFDVGIRFDHNPALDVLSIDAGTVIDVFLDNPIATGSGVVAFAPGGYRGCQHDSAAREKKRLLLRQIDDNRDFARR